MRYEVLSGMTIKVTFCRDVLSCKVTYAYRCCFENVFWCSYSMFSEKMLYVYGTMQHHILDDSDVEHSHAPKLSPFMRELWPLLSTAAHWHCFSCTALMAVTQSTSQEQSWACMTGMLPQTALSCLHLWLNKGQVILRMQLQSRLWFTRH